MAQTVPNAGPGDVLFTYDAPYSQYLRALGDEWGQAKRLEARLGEARKELDHLRTLSRRREPLASNDNLCFAAVVDIWPGQSGNDVAVVAELDKAQIQGEHTGIINLDPVNGFLGSLRHCAANVHTRIIVLQHSSLVSSEDDQPIQALVNSSEDDRPIQALFNSHLLGSELGLTPDYVSYLSQNRHTQGLWRQWHLRTPPSFTLGWSGTNANIALYLGRRSFGDGSPYTSQCM
jgi:hypothetical protein